MAALARPATRARRTVLTHQNFQDFGSVYRFRSLAFADSVRQGRILHDFGKQIIEVVSALLKKLRHRLFEQFFDPFFIH